MTIHQLSVFVENKSGTVVKVLDCFKENGIQLIAITIADTSEYGICRIVCSEPLRAYDCLKEAGIAVSISEVFAVSLADKPGAAADVLRLFTKEGISVAYLYAFLLAGKAVMVFRTDNKEKARSIIESSGLESIEDSLLSEVFV
ncbi:MAG: amino acid-binding protein [Bacteroidales bacterium]|nr:amino acid-binding protein [Bacteroidales bacterium]